MSETKKPSPLSRRNFLQAVGKAGGAVAVYETMTALGLLRTPEAYAGPPKLSGAAGKGQMVVILGAGIAGLTAAYELKRAGFEVTILEAQKRYGGRSFTVRPGDKIVEVTPEGRTEQVCQFDKGLYLNAGPGRIPHHHTAVIDYCKRLGVRLEMYVMSTRTNVFQEDKAFSSLPMVNHRIANDTRGYIAELLMKSIHRGALDQELSYEDRERLQSLLISFGDLSRDDKRKPPTYRYTGSSRSGYMVAPGVDANIMAMPPLKMNELLSSDFWDRMFYQPEDFLWQPTLFEPVGGMDQLARGFAETKELKDLIRYEREVVSIQQKDNRVLVRHRKAGAPQDGNPELTQADWCISTIPVPLLAKIDNNFSDTFKLALGSVEFESTCKVGWQAERRFWEEDDQVYGGISYTSHPITQMWYPSSGFFEQKGVLTGAYNYEGVADAFAARSLRERLQEAFSGAKRLHPRITEDDLPVEKGLSIAWKNVPYQHGGWAQWRSQDPVHTLAYRRILQSEGRFWVAGDQASQLPGWQEGAIRSAHYVIRQMTMPSEARLSNRDLEHKVTVPDSRESTRGQSREE
jgi:monoamine oxidase